MSSAIVSDMFLPWMGNLNNLRQPKVSFFFLEQEHRITLVKAYVM